MAKKNHELTPAFELFNKSLEIVKRNMNVFLILYTLPFLQVLVNLGSQRDGRHFRGSTFTSVGFIFGAVGAGLVLFIVALVVFAFLQAMLLGLELKGAKGQKPTFDALFKLAKKYWLRLIGLGIVVGVVVFVGLILLIIPGLIMIRRYILSPYILIDEDTSIDEAMRKSADMTKPYSNTIWPILGVMLLIALLGVFPVFGGLLSFGLGAIYSFAPAIRYLELKKLA